MSVAARPEVPLEAAQALARHIREKPEAVRSDPSLLAQEFGLSPQFVEEFLESLAAPREAPRAKGRFLKPIKRAFFGLRLLFRSLTSRPLAFIAVTAVVAIVGYLFAESLLSSSAVRSVARPLRPGGPNVSLTVEGSESLFLSVALTTLALHLACYFRHGRVRFPLFGGLICWLISAPTVMVLTWSTIKEQQDVAAPLTLIGIAVGMLFLNAFYTILGLVASVYGGSWRLRQMDRERDRLSRQDLLERMFDIQERLKASDGAYPVQQEKAIERWATRFNEHPWAYAAGIGLGLRLVEVGVGYVFSRHAGPGTTPPPLLALFALSVTALRLMCLVGIGFFSKETLKAIFRSWAFALAGFPPLLIPIAPFGVPPARVPWELALQLGGSFIVAAIASAGSKVEERAAQERRLTQNDPAALLAELVKLQWQLSPQTTDVCVLVVDAARSAEMKSMADPWTVEYSFREYQQFLEDIVHAEGGSVVSTAGDGAVAEFPTVEAAYRAARRIQTEVETFNRKVNRLERAFRLREGMHMGPVAGSINDVEFSAVIDIAAHVQGAAPIGGIALTAEVAKHLQGEPLAQLADPVDGQVVFLSMRPTGDD